MRLLLNNLPGFLQVLEWADEISGSSAIGPSIKPLINNDGSVIAFTTLSTGFGSIDVAGQNVVVFDGRGLGPRPPLTLSVSVDLISQTIRLSWPSILGRTFRVEFTTDLATANWRPLQNDLIATDTSSSITDALGLATARFFRVTMLPP